MPSRPGPSFRKTVSAAQILAARAPALYELADTPAAGPPRGSSRSPRTGGLLDRNQSAGRPRSSEKMWLLNVCC